MGGIALGGAAIGLIASGGIALGWHAALGGMAAAHELARGGAALANHANDSDAQQFFASHRWLDFTQTTPRNLLYTVCFTPILLQIGLELVAAENAEAGDRQLILFIWSLFARRTRHAALTENDDLNPITPQDEQNPNATSSPVRRRLFFGTSEFLDWKEVYSIFP